MALNELILAENLTATFDGINNTVTISISDAELLAKLQTLFAPGTNVTMTEDAGVITIAASVDAATITAALQSALVPGDGMVIVEDPSGVFTFSVNEATLETMLTAILVAGDGIEFTAGAGSITISSVATSVEAETIRDTVAAFIQPGTNITADYDDDNDTLTLSASGGGSGATSLAELTDTEVTEPAEGEGIVFRSGVWTNEPIVVSGGQAGAAVAANVVIPDPATADPVDLLIPFAWSIEGVTLLADQAGDVVLDIQVADYASYPTFTSIVAAAPPTLAASSKYQDTTLAGWTVSGEAGSILRISVTSADTVERLTAILSLRNEDVDTALADPTTTKGDLIVNDGSSLVRLPVGGDGQVVTADSTAPSGLSFSTPAGGGGGGFLAHPGWISGQWYDFASYWGGGQGTTSHTPGTLYCAPILVPVAASVSAIACQLTTALAGAMGRLGIYAADSAGLPGALVVDAGEVDLGTTGRKTLPLAEPLAAGLYYTAIQVSMGVSIRAYYMPNAAYPVGPFPFGQDDASDFSNGSLYRLATPSRSGLTYGPLPDPFGSIDGMAFVARRISLRAA